jgi:hypothetical protein
MCDFSLFLNESFLKVPSILFVFLDKLADFLHFLKVRLNILVVLLSREKLASQFGHLGFVESLGSG